METCIFHFVIELSAVMIMGHLRTTEQEWHNLIIMLMILHLHNAILTFSTIGQFTFMHYFITSRFHRLDFFFGTQKQVFHINNVINFKPMCKPWYL